ncbi:hypothetical protein [Bacillus sp. B-jedd]|uniref:hypothetical protein n=1 Tax=Bacillus sp. B-jedd TaxID=1476857 RepID=UPI0005156724|nr:hypothetical protein [Bacillus sp. B-jedd]CEG28560.1 hypothetical protein BN1002_03482 [Bacillus sp. B-jedd]
MKKLLALILPGLIILMFIWIDSKFPESKYVLVGIYFLFPVLFILQGYLASPSKETLAFGLLLSALAVIVPISIWYNIGNMMVPVIIYIILGIGSFFLFGKK